MARSGEFFLSSFDKLALEAQQMHMVLEKPARACVPRHSLGEPRVIPVIESELCKMRHEGTHQVKEGMASVELAYKRDP